MGPNWSELGALIESRDVDERAFAAGELRLRPRSEQRDALYARLDATARRVHAAARAAIRGGPPGARRVVDEVLAVPLELRDRLVEEILGLAYPPLDDAASSELVLDATSGLGEILFALDRAELGPGKVFVNLGAGSGKVALLAAALTGARAIGLELEPALVACGRGAAAELGLRDVELAVANLRAAPLPAADAYYMYIPFVGAADVVARLAPIAEGRPFLLFCQALDLRRLPWLTARGEGSYWLEAYAAAGALGR